MAIVARRLNGPDLHPTRRRPLLAVAAAVAVGVGADDCCSLPLCWLWGVALGALLAWLSTWRGERRHCRLAALLMAAASTGAAWHHLRWSYFDLDDVGSFASADFAPVIVRAEAREAPRRMAAPPFDPMNAVPRGERSRLEVEVAAIRDGTQWRRATGIALLTIEGQLTDVHAGDRVEIVAGLAAPPPPLNPGAFDYAAYLRARRIRATLFAENPQCVRVMDTASPWRPRTWLGRLRENAERGLARFVDARRTGLAATLLLNSREQLEAVRTEAFLETGTIHHLAISGTHVGILAAAMFIVLRLGMLPRGLALAMICALTALYAIVTRGEAPVVRATVLVWIVCLALQLGRQPLGWNSLAAAAVAVLAWNPAELFDVGAQLSFLSVAVLIHLAANWQSSEPIDPLDRLIAATRPWPMRALNAVWKGTWRMAVVSFTVWLVTMPLIMARFHLVSPVAVALNPLLWLPVAVALLSGFGVLGLGGLAPPLACGCGWLCDRSLALTEWGVAALNRIPGGHAYVPGPSDWWLVGFYAGCAAPAFFPAWRLARTWRIGLLAGWIAVGLIPSLWTAGRERPLRCHVLAVGHGSAVLIELPDGRRLLYDAGQLGLPSTAARTIADALWSRGVTHLDALVISHADVDHYCAVPALLHRFSIGRVYVSPHMFRRATPALEALRHALDGAGVQCDVIDTQYRVRAGEGVAIEVLHPTRAGVEGSDNANSIVLMVSYREKRILLTGDLEPPGVDAVLGERPEDCDVLVAPHHGSGGSNPLGLIAWCRPEWVIISGSRRDVSPRVMTTYAQQGARVSHTAIQGAVSIDIADGSIDVRPSLEVEASR